MPPRLPYLIGILAWCFLGTTNARASTRVRLPVPTSETIPYVAEVMGATSYEESYEEGSGEVKRVQRKLSGPGQRQEPDLDQEEQYTDYQGVIGRPGVDFPVLPSIPRTDFNCRKVKSSGYYADLDTGCQVFHICDGGRKISFLCPNGTIFRQSHLICDWWFRVDCERSVELYEESAEQLAHDQMIYKKRAEEIAKAMNAKLIVTETAPSSTSATYTPRQPQQQQRRRPRPQTQPEPVEQERQVPAETASFVSNKHRFGNQLENQYRQYYATSTNAPPTSYTNRQTDFDYKTQQYQENQDTAAQINFENNRQKPFENAQYYSSYSINNSPSTSRDIYPSTVQNSYSSTTTNNFPSSNTYPSSMKNNVQTTTSRMDTSSYNDNNYSKPNNNAPSEIKEYSGPRRGNVNYLNSNINGGTSQHYTVSPSNYNFSTTKNGNDYSSTSQKLIEYSNNETPSSQVPRQSTQSDYIPYASTTIRSVTSNIGSYNDHSTRSEKFSRIKQKPIFNVKIKPTKDTKNIAYVELLRQEEKNQDFKSVTPETYTYSSPSPASEEENYYTIPVSQLVSTLAPPSSVTESKSRNTYLPKKVKIDKKESSTKATVTSRYASINVSGTSEEIHPEIVNALMERGVTPTSAKALHSLASYISSGAAEEDYSNVYNDGNHRHVSDVILNFHSGSSITTGSEGTTNTPLTSSGEVLPSVLTKATKESYSYLFSDSKEQADLRNEELDLLSKVDASTQKPRTTTQASIVQTTSKQESKEDLKLKESSELRELAQVFSRALSAYLEDPETFKEILAQVRPTEPNVENTTPSVEDEVLDFSDAMLGKSRTTVTPVTSIGNADYVDDNVNIGDINSLASVKAYEQDNSVEHNTFPPTAPEAIQENQYTSAPTKLLFFNTKNDSETSNYYSKLGSAEDQSYFPTAGGVSDASRPRYGGFQNNTNKNSKIYSPYGSDVPKNITGPPISSPRPTTSPQDPMNKNKYNNTSSAQNIPEPRDVNSLIKSNILNGDRASSEESFDFYQTSPSFLQEESYSPGDQEKVLVASGSQSLVSSNNYVQFAKKFNEQQMQEGKKQQERFYKTKQQGRPAPSQSPISLNTQEDLTPYFGQEPPLENLAKPSGFKTQNHDRPNNQANYVNSDPINYHIGTSIDTFGTPSTVAGSSQNYDISFGRNLGSTTEEKLGSPSIRTSPSGWTVSPLFDVTSAGTSIQLNYTQNPSSSSSSRYHPTTYHPPHSKESVEVSDNESETTLLTENNSSGDTTPAYDLNGAATTLSSEDQYKIFEKAAREMFGMLNETAAITLMNMMAKGESNMTIRRLVLLLVNDKGKNNTSAQESRESLISALLTNPEASMTTLPARPVTQTTTLSPRKKVRVSRVRLSPPPQKSGQASGKSYRGTDSLTGVHGSVPSPSDLNKLNSAKLYIPTPSAAALTSSKLPLDSDTRAVELLKTLYSLAAKWG